MPTSCTIHTRPLSIAGLSWAGAPIRRQGGADLQRTGAVRQRARALSTGRQPPYQPAAQDLRPKKGDGILMACSAVRRPRDCTRRSVAARARSHRHMLGEAVAGCFRTLPLIDGGNQGMGKMVDGVVTANTRSGRPGCELSQPPIGHSTLTRADVAQTVSLRESQGMCIMPSLNSVNMAVERMGHGQPRCHR